MELEIVLPAVITIENTTDKEIGFVPYRENFTVYLKSGDVVSLEAATAGQVFYYLALNAENGLTVTQEAKA